MKTSISPISTLVAFEKANSINGGYPTSALANEYAKLRLDAFNNEVCLGTDEKDGLFFVSFNLFD